MRNNCIKSRREQRKVLLELCVCYCSKYLCTEFNIWSFVVKTSPRLMHKLQGVEYWPSYMHSLWEREQMQWNCRTRAAGDRYKLKKRSFWLGERIWEWKNKRGRGSRWKRRGGLQMSIWGLVWIHTKSGVHTKSNASSPFHLIACSVFRLLRSGRQGMAIKNPTAKGWNSTNFWRNATQSQAALANNGTRRLPWEEEHCLPCLSCSLCCTIAKPRSSFDLWTFFRAWGQEMEGKYRARFIYFFFSFDV